MLINNEENKALMLKELESLPIEEGFELPEGFPIPYGEWVIIKKGKQEEQMLRSGLIMPGGETKNALIGTMFAFGSGCLKPLKTGTKVLFSPNANQSIVYDGITYLYMSEYDVYCNLPPKSYIPPHYKDLKEKVRELRVGQMANKNKAETDKLEEKFEKRDNMLKKEDKISAIKPKKTVIKAS